MCFQEFFFKFFLTVTYSFVRLAFLKPSFENVCLIHKALDFIVCYCFLYYYTTFFISLFFVTDSPVNKLFILEYHSFKLAYLERMCIIEIIQWKVYNSTNFKFWFIFQMQPLCQERIFPFSYIQCFPDFLTVVFFLPPVVSS